MAESSARHADKSHEDTCTWNRNLTNLKTTVRVGLRNVLSMYSTGKTAQVCREKNCLERECNEIRLTSWAEEMSLAIKKGIYGGKKSQAQSPTWHGGEELKKEYLGGMLFHFRVIPSIKFSSIH